MSSALAAVKLFNCTWRKKRIEAKNAPTIFWSRKLPNKDVFATKLYAIVTKSAWIKYNFLFESNTNQFESFLHFNSIVFHPKTINNFFFLCSNFPPIPSNWQMQSVKVFANMNYVHSCWLICSERIKKKEKKSKNKIKHELYCV